MTRSFGEWKEKKKNNVCHHFSLISHGDARQNKQILTRGGKSQEKLAATTSASARPCLVNQDQFGTCLTRSVSRAGVLRMRISRISFLWASMHVFASVCVPPVSEVAGSVPRGWLGGGKVGAGGRSLHCKPLIRAIRLFPACCTQRRELGDVSQLLQVTEMVCKLLLIRHLIVR